MDLRTMPGQSLASVTEQILIAITPHACLSFALFIDYDLHSN